MESIKNITNILQDGKNIFLTGGAGVGKTTLTKGVIKEFEANSKKVAKLASTAMAATLIDGQTLHSFFDLGIAKNQDELLLNGKFDITKKVKKLVSSMDLIVIDEISMVSDEVLELIYLRLNQANFYGSLLVVGDFLQLPPVNKGSNRLKFAFQSDIWKKLNFKNIVLTHIYRTDDKEFIKLLHNIRFGYIDENIHNQLNQFIKPLPKELNDFTFLFGKNLSANIYNKNQLDNIDGDIFIKEVRVIKHLKSIKDYEVDKFLDDANIEKELVLKIGVPILFTRNSWNYFNGERGVVVNIDDEHIFIRKKDGKIVKLERVYKVKTLWKEKNINGKRELVEDELFRVYYYPIKLAFAITIHKSQGMSIENLIIQTNEIFAPSQFYVALSRSLNPKRLILIAPNKQWYQIIFVNKDALDFVKRL